MAEGTKDVSTDLQARTGLQPTDKILMVNAATQDVQYVTAEELGDQVGGANPVFSNSSNIEI